MTKTDRPGLEGQMATELRTLERADRMWSPRTLQGPTGSWAKVDGRKELMLCTNDYLGLANNPELKRSSIQAVREYGVGSGAVRVISGTMDLHKELETELARFKGAESSVTFQSGFVANLGVISTLMTEKDLVISDELNHGSIIDGIRLSRAEKRVYAHADTKSLAEALEGSDKFERVMVVTDAVFSMEGDIAPLPEVVRLARRAGALTYVDDAHGEGVLGELGRGAVNHFHLEGKVEVDMGTFSKAFGSVGGYVVGGANMCEVLRNRVRAYLLSGAHPPAVAAANLASIRYVQKHPELFKRLWRNTRFFKKGLKRLGFDTGRSETPITPIMVNDEKRAKQMADMLFKEGMYVIPIVYPMVPRGKARLRTIVNAKHSRSDLELAISLLEDVGRKLKVIN